MTREQLDALLAEVERLKNELAMAVQVSGEICEKCGWAMKFPDEPCRCELLAEVERLTAERDAAIEAARPSPSLPTPVNDAQTIYQVGYEDGQKQGMDRMQQAIIDLLSDADPNIIARIVTMEYP